MPVSKREKLLNTAIDLFSRRGFHGTGIDRIAAEASVSKKTMYRYFRSKDELILATLRHYDSEYRNHFARAVESHGDTPRERLLAVFDAARDWFHEEGFYGCVFMKAAGEYSDASDPIKQFCAEAKRLIRSYIEELAIAAGVEQPTTLAAELALLLEGAIVMAHIDNDARHATTAQRAAARLISQAADGA